MKVRLETELELAAMSVLWWSNLHRSDPAVPLVRPRDELPNNCASDPIPMYSLEGCHAVPVRRRITTFDFTGGDMMHMSAMTCWARKHAHRLPLS